MFCLLAREKNHPRARTTRGKEVLIYSLLLSSFLLLLPFFFSLNRPLTVDFGSTVRYRVIRQGLQFRSILVYLCSVRYVPTIHRGVVRILIVIARYNPISPDIGSSDRYHLIESFAYRHPSGSMRLEKVLSFYRREQRV
ncbi:hypothetical protein BHM03_00053161 [Ensete ventricosum]|nr:hypothetical protein BHM03_00053161 [Ensete ventricosum]